MEGSSFLIISRRKTSFRVWGLISRYDVGCTGDLYDKEKGLVSLEMGFPHELLDLTRCLVLTSLAVCPPKQIIVSHSQIGKVSFRQGGFSAAYKDFCPSLQRGPRGVCFLEQSVKYCPISQEGGWGVGGAYEGQHKTGKHCSASPICRFMGRTNGSDRMNIFWGKQAKSTDLLQGRYEFKLEELLGELVGSTFEENNWEKKTRIQGVFQVPR